MPIERKLGVGRERKVKECEEDAREEVECKRERKAWKR